MEEPLPNYPTPPPRELPPYTPRCYRGIGGDVVGTQKLGANHPSFTRQSTYLKVSNTSYVFEQNKAGALPGNRALHTAAQLFSQHKRPMLHMFV